MLGKPPDTRVFNVIGYYRNDDGSRGSRIDTLVAVGNYDEETVPDYFDNQIFYWFDCLEDLTIGDVDSEWGIETIGEEIQ